LELKLNQKLEQEKYKKQKSLAKTQIPKIEFEEH
jgi:hypothetical protein